MENVLRSSSRLYIFYICDTEVVCIVAGGTRASFGDARTPEETKIPEGTATSDAQMSRDASIGLICTDLDGTLLNGEHRVSRVNMTAIRQLRARGIKLVLASTRSHYGCQSVVDVLGVDTPVICYEGAQVRSPGGDPILYNVEMEVEPARQIAAYCDREEIELAIAFASGRTFVRSREKRPRERGKLWVKAVSRYTPVVTKPPIRMIATGRNDARRIHAKFSGALADHIRFSRAHDRGRLASVTMVSAETSKGRALSFVCEHLGIAPSATLSIGDNEADVELFRTAGVGVAMGSAEPAVKQAADYVAPTNDEDGFAWAVRKFVLEAGG